ncbi:MAG: hypothetical protein V9G19_11400 [Tetrasphaera sp.]
MEALRAVISSVEAWQVEPETASASLKRHFGVSQPGRLWAARARPEAVRAAAAILTYVQAMQSSALGLLTRLHGYTIGEFMTLDEATRRNLELTETHARRRHHAAACSACSMTRSHRWAAGCCAAGSTSHCSMSLPSTGGWTPCSCFIDNTVLRLEARAHLHQHRRPGALEQPRHPGHCAAARPGGDARSAGTRTAIEWGCEVAGVLGT